uniref:Uncharacterized protein n=1 Tax=Lactuca sativa TaxID=4236 RepID=A0A9R1W0K7_LACSA|nr:hypothetical protein LSAT_V11C400226260 [Lactuca sativa]
MEAMSAITPTAHRCSVVHSRPFSLVVSLCLQSHLQNAMRVISDIFPVLEISSESSKFSMVVSGFSIPLVYRPGLLLCGIEGVGLDHLGPSILHELENFPVHALGLSSLLSDPSAKTPKEALVQVILITHIPAYILLCNLYAHGTPCYHYMCPKQGNTPHDNDETTLAESMHNIYT